MGQNGWKKRSDDDTKDTHEWSNSRRWESTWESRHGKANSSVRDNGYSAHNWSNERKRESKKESKHSKKTVEDDLADWKGRVSRAWLDDRMKASKHSQNR